jgi:hypothetical protein
VIGTSPDAILLALEAHVKTWCDANKGKVSIAGDAFNVLELLEQSPSGLRVVLYWHGDDAAGDVPQGGVTTNELHVILTYNRGLAIWQGRHTVEGKGEREPLFKLLSSLRAHIRKFVLGGEAIADTLGYKGAASLPMPNGLPLDAYDMTFTLDAAIEADEESSEESGS